MLINARTTMRIKDDTCFVRHLIGPDDEFVFLTHYLEIWDNGYSTDSYNIDFEYIYYEGANYHGFDPDLIDDPGTYITKKQFITWTEQIQQAKKTTVRMLHETATPINRNIEEGDYLLCTWVHNKEDDGYLSDNEYLGLRVVEIKDDSIFVQRVYIGLHGLDSCDDIDWMDESLDDIRRRSCFITAEAFKTTHDYIRSFCRLMLDETKSHAQITEQY